MHLDLGRDLQSSRWLIIKGALFFVIACSAGLILWFAQPNLITAFLLAMLAWASARFYYFLFYVLEKYVDPSLRYSGVVDLVRTLRRDRLRGRSRER